MTFISHDVKIESAHRQMDDPGKCGKLHGHNWLIQVFIEGTANALGYIVDFKELDDMFEKFDHAVLLRYDDPLIDVLTKMEQKVVTLQENPTCEDLSQLFCYKVRKHLADKDVKFRGVLVRVHENDRSSAEAKYEAQ